MVHVVFFSPMFYMTYQYSDECKSVLCVIFCYILRRSPFWITILQILPYIWILSLIKLFCHLFFFKEKQIQIQKTYKNIWHHINILIQLYTYKRHLIYKNTTFASLHWNFKHQGQFNMATTFYIYTLLWQRLFFFNTISLIKKTPL